MAPNTLVTTIWEIFPTTIPTTPTIRLRGDRKNTRPPYSPIRLGVKTAKVSPQKTDSMARHTEIRSTITNNRRHFTTSSPQFTNISRSTLPKQTHKTPTSAPFMRFMKFSRSELCANFLKMNQKANITKVALMQNERNFLCWIVNIMHLLSANMLIIVVCWQKKRSGLLWASIPVPL